MLSSSCGGGDDGGRTDASAGTLGFSTTDAADSETTTAVTGGDDSTSDTTTGGATTGTTAVSETDGSSTADSETTDTDDPTGTTSDPDANCPSEQPPGAQGPINDACMAALAGDSYEGVAEWTREDFQLVAGSTASLSTPIVIPLEPQGDPDIVMLTILGAYGVEATGVLRALAGDGSVERWAIPDQEIYGQSGIAAGDVDGDGRPEIFVATVDHRIKRFDHDGALQWTSESLASEEIRADHPAISDMDHDGEPEVIVGRVILQSADGTVRGIGSHGRGSAFSNQGRRFSTSFAADVDADGTEEVLVGNAMYDPDGALLWQNGEPDGFVAAADFDADGDAEIVVAGLGRLRLQSHEGAVLWDVAIPDAQSWGGPPTIADFDGDGEPEIGVAGRGAYVVFEGDGAVLWSRAIVDLSGITGSSAHDFDGDGAAEVVYADESTLWVLSGVDGAVKLAFAEHSSATNVEMPVIADVDDDGAAEIVVVHNMIGANKDRSGVTVVGDAANAWRDARRTWNQYAYSISNVSDDGAIPIEAEVNWTLYNSFRSGDTSPPDGLKAPDLVIEATTCGEHCLAGEQALWIRLGNAGASPLTAGAVLTVFGVKRGVESLIEAIPWETPLAPGEVTPGIQVTADPLEIDAYVVRVAAGEAECDLDNNEVVLAATLCLDPG